ncbi:MAG TPA: hypothetical protein VMT50_11640 [Steroidobacteraceae bacterium]|nr:hypothetical protein [Steroidobacteraceae bacterium]
MVIAAAGWLLASSAIADPNDYVYTPDVTYGEREIDFKYGVAGKDHEPTAQATSLGFGYGAKDWWFTEFYVKGARDGAQSTFDAVEFENKFRLTETGKYPVDLGLIVEFELPHDRSEGNELRFGPLLQGELGRWQLNFNPLLTNISRSASSNGTYFGYQWQVKYRWQESLEFGAQGFGETGRWDHWLPSDEQSHRFGPALFGRHGLGGGQAIVWNAGVLFGVTQGAYDWNFRLQAEYEF